MRGMLAAFTLSGLLFALAYAFLMPGNPVWSYLSSYFTTAFAELNHILAGSGSARPLFASHGAPPAPAWDRLLMLGAVAPATLGLPFGLFSLWKQHRHNALSITLSIFALAYPVTQVFRFTNYGSEITDRSAAFLFLPLAYVLAIFITQFWPTRHLNRRAIALISCVLSVMLLGGALLGATVYSAACSPLGAATQTGAERSTERRSGSETAVHLTASLTFGLVTAYAYRWLRERW